jgi:hypothetical protein
MRQWTRQSQREAFRCAALLGRPAYGVWLTSWLPEVALCHCLFAFGHSMCPVVGVAPWRSWGASGPYGPLAHFWSR